MTEQERIWDLRLQIQTSGRDDTNADAYRYPYEPTPYPVLDRLALSGLIRPGDGVVDYGCGKGRVGFFLAHRTGARVTGIEYDRQIHRCALENRESALCGTLAEFVLTRAEAYPVPREISRCYFFNPFSQEILRKVMARILESYYEYPREIFLFFYYPSDEYIAYLMTLEALEFYDEIDCQDLYEETDPRERILIFQLPDCHSPEEA